ncbi:putative Cysteine-rich RLK (RECEPTOR-like protein kinase) 8 [Cucumis melo var. makuwa]|uniref:Cysteine-rich RLK (RECEPTOR-like protein kinase) 8 n=1 Tax=Cucumis melo var. makuwa TaxID=1194695 RepID=A0A5A7VDR1_CUCMM|nr:putative Cysteine-rich RLK (RECEPTOR-like protein kinase) 8 [Cucumis melo var. makuwa]TYK00964.1 putative Cysteine-rich RLK (RECEPTOR-like protein kinase) 8 [Cucumis melo var. makuwa]
MDTNQTWSIVPLPKGKNSIGCRWVYMIKHKADGSIERYKACLVAKGYTQQEGLDYFETFLPVAKMVTVKTLLTIAVAKEWSLVQLDVNNAFLHGELFEESKADYSLFIRGKNNSFIALLAYVDDIIITGANALHIQELKRALNQKDYTLQLIEDTGLLGAKPTSVLMDPATKLNASDKDILHMTATPYRRLIGQLLYLTISQSNITFAVHKLSQFMAKPTINHMNATNHLIKYLKGSPRKGIMLPKVQDFSINAFVDADWGSCPDTRYSVTGFCVFLGNSLVSWKSKKQQTVAKSSAKDEYRALAITTCEVIWLRSLLNELQIKAPSPTFLMTIKPPSTLQTIPCFMKEPNISS